jgi:hydroxylamine reductase (hybrid-cluster protein)
LYLLGEIMAIPWLALAVAGGSAYQGYEARKARKDAERQQSQALAQQQADSMAMRNELARQTAEYAKQGASLEQQAQMARQQFEAQQLQYQESRLSMEQKSKEVQAAADEERRKAAAAEASALKARTRGGRRALLSQERLTPELGITSAQLSPGMELS